MHTHTLNLITRVLRVFVLRVFVLRVCVCIVHTHLGEHIYTGTLLQPLTKKIKLPKKKKDIYGHLPTAPMTCFSLVSAFV
jgi:hypothetical protein